MYSGFKKYNFSYEDIIYIISIVCVVIICKDLTDPSINIVKCLNAA